MPLMKVHVKNNDMCESNTGLYLYVHIHRAILHCNKGIDRCYALEGDFCFPFLLSFTFPPSPLGNEIWVPENPGNPPIFKPVNPGLCALKNPGLTGSVLGVSTARCARNSVQKFIFGGLWEPNLKFEIQSKSLTLNHLLRGSAAVA